MSPYLVAIILCLLALPLVAGVLDALGLDRPGDD